jgi:hypothetical protein
VYRELFGLNDVEADRIAELIPKKQFLVKRPDVAKVLTLSVDPGAHALFATGAAEQNARRNPSGQDGEEHRLEILARSHS